MISVPDALKVPDLVNNGYFPPIIPPKIANKAFLMCSVFGFWHHSQSPFFLWGGKGIGWGLFCSDASN